MSVNARLWFPALAAGLVALAGCSRGGHSTGDYTPPADRSRQSLEAALNHWKSGGSPGAVEGTTPKVQAVDAKWKAGQKLREYEIVGEDDPGATGGGAAPRYYKVRLTTNKGGPQDVRYVVVGIDPIWVYREEDYKGLGEMGK